MDLDYKEYEEECIKIREENEKCMEIFQAELIEKGFSTRTIKSHLNNIEFYINDFLLYSEPLPMNEGCGCVDSFLGDFLLESVCGQRLLR